MDKQHCRSTYNQIFILIVIAGFSLLFLRSDEAESAPWSGGGKRSELKTGKQSFAVRVKGERACVRNRVDRGMAAKMVDKAIKAIGKSADIKVAWKNILGDAKTIGIKVDCGPGPKYSTSPHVVTGVTDSLISAGYPKRNIIIFDGSTAALRAAGFLVNRSNSGVRCFGIDGKFENEQIVVGEKGAARFKRIAYLSSLVVKELDAIIVMPVLKTSDVAGVELSLMSALDYLKNKSNFISTYSDPHCANVNMIPAIRKKTKLAIIDGMRGIYKGSKFVPTYIFEPGELIASTDIVAADSAGVVVIDEKRKSVNMESLRSEVTRPDGSKKLSFPIYHLYRAQNYEIGQFELSRIKMESHEIKR